MTGLAGPRPSAGARAAVETAAVGALRRRLPVSPAALELVEGAAVAAVAAELATLVRAGTGPGPAWRHAGGEPAAGRVGAAVRAAADAAQRGDEVAPVLRAAAHAPPAASPSAPLLALAAAWQVAERSGAPPADVLDRIAHALAADREQALATASALAGPRSTAAVLAALPLGGLGLGVLLGLDPLAVLLGTPAGRLSGAVGVGCGLTGWWWTRRLVRAAERAG